MALLGASVPIESAEPVLRARRTAALARVAVGCLGIGLVLGWPSLSMHPGLALAGFGLVLATALVQLSVARTGPLPAEESISGIAAVLIVGFGGEQVNVVSLLWLVAVVSGVLARGGRVHWLGRTIVLSALVLPVPIAGSLTPEYAAMCVAAIAILLTSGRVTQELNLLLRQARLQADNAETLLLAGDIAARVAGRREQEPSAPAAVQLDEQELAGARLALARLVEGEGLAIFVQPIADIRSGEVHAYEALARFGEARSGSSPLHWFALAEQLGARPVLERACLQGALALLGSRPAGTVLTVNLSAPVLGEAQTIELLLEAAGRQPDELNGLVVEITEETLVESGEELGAAIGPLYARGMRLAVDDMGAGYSGLRQITSLAPSYLKLDRALCAGIDGDDDRAALVEALAGYARQVGSHLVAEGIETDEELHTLRRIGVPLVQGFRLARPAPPWPAVDSAARPPRQRSSSAETVERSGAAASLPT